MTIHDYAQSYKDATEVIIAAVTLITAENIDKTDHAGWSPRRSC